MVCRIGIVHDGRVRNLAMELVMVFLMPARGLVLCVCGRCIHKRWPCRQMMVHHAGG